MLVGRLFGSDSEGRLERLATHHALGGSDPSDLQAQLTRRRGDVVAARHQVTGALDRSPGHRPAPPCQQRAHVASRRDHQPGDPASMTGDEQYAPCDVPKRLALCRETVDTLPRGS